MADPSPAGNVVPMGAQRPAGGLPPSLQGAPGNAGGATQAQPKLGNMAGAADKIKVALQALQEALPAIPMGSPLHTEVLNTIKRLGSKMETGEAQSAPPLQALLQMLRQAPQQNQMAMLARMAPPGGGAGGGAPQMPSPAAAAA